MRQSAAQFLARMLSSATILAVLLVAAGRSDAAEDMEIRYAAMPLLSQAPIVIAERRGLFAAEGVKVSLLRVQSGAQGLEAVMAGSADAAHISDTPLIYAASNGLKIVVVADNGRITKENPQSAILVKADSAIHSLADLRGKKIANLPPGTINDVQLKGLILPQLGLKPGTDVSIVVAGFPDMPGMLRAGTVDAALENEPFVTTMLKQGDFRVLSNLSDFIPNSGNYLSMIAFRQDFLSSHAAVVQHFLRAYVKAVAVYTHDKEERVAALSEWVKLPRDILGDVPPLEISENARIDVDALTPVADTLLKLGYIKNPVDIRPYVDNSYLPK
jgi:NitT/TauT family transport system substrate-binding protein